MRQHWIHAATRLYTSIALVVVNCALALILLNGAAAIFLKLNRPRPAALDTPTEEQTLAALFPSLNREQIRLLIEETGSLSYTFEPYTLFRDRPRRGTYINLEPQGFRHSAQQGPWPPSPDNVNVFVFGGSTTFGWLVPDGHTIPSYLQAEIAERTGQRVAVYNFGRTNYIANQERILFEQLLVQGLRPDFAVFVDGCNDALLMDGSPAFSQSFSLLVENRLPSPLKRLALYRVASQLRARLMQPPSPVLPEDSTSLNARRALAADQMVRRYAANKELTERVAAAHGVTTLFVWQPVPGYRYDLSKHPFARNGAWRLAGMPEVYSRMEAQFAAHSEQENSHRNFIWCADVHDGASGPLYLDIVHYTPAMSQRVAQCIAHQAIARGLFVVPTRPSGIPLRIGQVPL